MNDSKFQHTDRRFVDSGLYRSFITERQPMRSFNASTGDTISVFKESTSKDLPQMSQMSSIQKSQNFVESHSTNTDILTRSILDEMRSQHRLDKPVSHTIPITFGSNSSNASKDNRIDNGIVINRTIVTGDENARTIAPVQSVERSFTNTTVEDTETNKEEKTVIIKRKITRRKKGGEKPNLLRDSYIERISSPLPSQDYSGDSDEDHSSMTTTKSTVPVSEVMSQKKSQANEKLPTIFEPIKAVQEEIIIPQKKSNVKSSLPYDRLSNLDYKDSQSYETNQKADWEYKDSSVPPVQLRQYQFNNLLSEDDDGIRPTIFENTPSAVQEEIIIPQKKDTVKSGLPYQMLANLDQNDDQSYEPGAKVYRESRDSTTPRSTVMSHYSSNLLPEENIKTTVINQKQATPASTYSARKENLKVMDDRSSFAKPLQAERNSSQRNEMTEEIETITLQPIGKGVHDLAPPPSATISRPNSRAATPKNFDSGTVRTYYKDESRQMGNYNTNYNTMPAMPKFAKTNSVRNVDQTSNYELADYKPTNLSQRASNERSYTTSVNRTTNEQVRGGSSSRSHNEQGGHASWQMRGGSTSESNRAYQWPLTPTSPRTPLSNIVLSAVDDHRCSLQMVLNSEDQWYQPNHTRDDVVTLLRNKEPGSFFVRNSSTFAGSYGLAVKVTNLPQNAVRSSDPQGDLVRHFLIETVNDSSGNGVRLKGFDNELAYPSLAHLVQAHCHNPIALPIRLLLPHSSSIKVVVESEATSKPHYQYEQVQQQSLKAPLLSQSHRSLSSPGVNFTSTTHPNPLHQTFELTIIYLGKVETDRKTGDEAIQAAVDKIMNKPSIKSTTIVMTLDSTKGITLKDKMEKIFYSRQFPAQHVLYAGFDPKQRLFASNLPQSTGPNRRIIGVVVKKQKMILRENAVHLFCDMDDPTTTNDVITFINENYLRRA